MLRISLLFIASTFSLSVFADAVSECKSAAAESVNQCVKNASKTATTQDMNAGALASACDANRNINECAGNFGGQGLNNQAALQVSNDFCEKQFKNCEKTCNPSKGKNPNEIKFLTDQQKHCRSKIDDVKKQLDAGKGGNGDAKDGGKKTADKSGSDKTGNSSSKQANNSSSPMMPPMTPPQPQQSNNNSTPPTQMADNSTPQQAPAAPQSTPPPSQEKAATGKAGFTTASKPTTNPCAALNSSEISGCSGTAASAPVQAPAAATPFGSNAFAGGGGGSSGSSGGGGLAAAAAALSNGAKLPGETEKDGKNTGIKAASINIGTDGGGGGGGGGSDRNYDLDFSALKQPLRNPASSALNKAIPASATGPLSQVGAQRVSVTKIVTDVYVHRCNAGLLHCGNNK